MYKANSISLAVHVGILILFFVFTGYVSYLEGVFKDLHGNHAPYIIFAVLSVIAYFFTGFFIASVCGIRAARFGNLFYVCIVALLGLAAWSIIMFYSRQQYAEIDGLEWLFFYIFYMPFLSLTNLIQDFTIPDYLFAVVSFIPTFLMWAGIQYRASMFKKTSKV